MFVFGITANTIRSLFNFSLRFYKRVIPISDSFLLLSLKG